MVTTPSVIYAIDPGSGYNRWIYGRYGCTIRGAVLGTAGALISQNCTNPQLPARRSSAPAGRSCCCATASTAVDDNDKVNPDRIHWNLVGNTDVPVSADAVIGALNPTTTRARRLPRRQGPAGLGRRAWFRPAGGDPSTAASLRRARAAVARRRHLRRAAPARTARTGPTPRPPADRRPGRVGRRSLSEPTALITVTTPTGARELDPSSGTDHRRPPPSAPAPPRGSRGLPAGHRVAGRAARVRRPVLYR